jgi:hypothetical protein
MLFKRLLAHARLIIRSAACAVAFVVVCAPASATTLRSMGTQPSPSIFGINTGTFDSSHANFVNDMPAARRLGARWVHFTGASIHFSRNGQPKYGTLDYEVTRARKLGLGVLVSLGGAPAACSLSPRPADPTTCPPTTPRALAVYQRFLRSELLRYRNVVQYWESWLEPNHRSFWPSGPNPDQYANLLRAEYQVFQSVNRALGTHLKLLFAGPSDFSIIPGSPGGSPILPFVHTALVDLRGARVFDGIALHPYRFPPATTGPSVADWDSVQGIPSAPGASGPYPAEGCNSPRWCQMTWPHELSAYEQEFANQGYGQMPLWLTEFGWPGSPRTSDNFHPSYSAQAQFLSEAYADILGLPYVRAAFWFNLRDYQPGLRNPDPEFFAHYGLLQYGFAAKPAGTVFKRLAQGNPGR